MFYHIKGFMHTHTHFQTVYRPSIPDEAAITFMVTVNIINKTFTFLLVVNANKYIYTTKTFVSTYMAEI